MSVLIIGGGSMGRRRLRDVIYLKQAEVSLYEPVADRCEKVAGAFGIRGFTDLEAAFAQELTAVIVSTPPALHEPYVRRAMELGLHVFAEVPFVLDLNALTEIAARAPSYGSVLFASDTIRYYPPFRLIHDLLSQGAIGQPLYLEYSLGHYLPGWHPYEDYRKFYASDARLGGAGMDMIPHEFNAIRWWMGPIDSVNARLNKLSSLEITGPDNHDAMLTFASGACGFFHHDVIEQGTMGHHIRIAGAEGTIEWHQNLPSVRLYQDSVNRQLGFDSAADWDLALGASREIAQMLARSNAESGRTFSDADGFTYESCYLREMRCFLDAINGRVPYSAGRIPDELETIRTFQAIVESSAKKSVVQVSSVKMKEN